MLFPMTPPGVFDVTHYIRTILPCVNYVSTVCVCTFAVVHLSSFTITHASSNTTTAFYITSADSNMYNT